MRDTDIRTTGARLRWRRLLLSLDQGRIRSMQGNRGACWTGSIWFGGFRPAIYRTN